MSPLLSILLLPKHQMYIKSANNNIHQQHEVLQGSLHILKYVQQELFSPTYTSIYILLITSETKKPPACTMYALAHRLYEYYYATNSYKVLQAIFLDYYATHENAASSSAQGRKIYMIPNYLHSKVLALFCSILCKICPYYTFIEEKL